MVNSGETVAGQKGHMVIQEDGAIISTSGDLANNETIVPILMRMMSQPLHVDFSGDSSKNGADGDTTGNTRSFVNGSHDAGKTFKWNKVIINFGNQSYFACLSNKRLHIMKRDQQEVTPTTPTPVAE